MKLIIINGPCGIGKSTLAARLHDSMPLSFLLDIDAQRRFISHYRESKEKSGEATMTISNAIIKSCLEMDNSIIVDKMLFDPLIIDSYHELAKLHGADIYEILLWAPMDVVMQRATERGWKEAGLLTPEKCEFFWHKINELKSLRPQAHIINIENIDEEALYIQVAKIVRISY